MSKITELSDAHKELRKSFNELKTTNALIITRILDLENAQHTDPNAVQALIDDAKAMKAEMDNEEDKLDDLTGGTTPSA